MGYIFLTVKGLKYFFRRCLSIFLADHQGFEIMLFGHCLSIISVQDKIDGAFLTVKGSK